MAIRKKNDFMSGYVSERDEEKRQQRLRKKHRVEDPMVKVVEKDHSFLMVLKFLSCRLGDLVRLVFNAILFVLAAVGIVSLMLDATRNTLLAYFSELFHLFF